MVLFCCDVGESDLKLKARCLSSNVLYKKYSLTSVNEAIYQKWLCVMCYKKKNVNQYFYTFVSSFYLLVQLFLNPFFSTFFFDLLLLLRITVLN